MPRKGGIRMAVVLSNVPAADAQADKDIPGTVGIDIPRSAGEKEEFPAGNDTASTHTPGEKSVPPDSVHEAEETLADLIKMIEQKQYDVIPSLSGYLVTEDPTYLPEDSTVRGTARRLGCDRMLSLLISSYIQTHENAE